MIRLLISSEIDAVNGGTVYNQNYIAAASALLGSGAGILFASILSCFRPLICPHCYQLDSVTTSGNIITRTWSLPEGEGPGLCRAFAFFGLVISVAAIVSGGYMLPSWSNLDKKR